MTASHIQSLRASSMVLLIVAWIAICLPAQAIAAQDAVETTPQDAADRLFNGVFRGRQSESIDLNAVQQVVADARSRGLTLTVAVFGSELVDAAEFADGLADIVGGTVVVFTDAEYSISSDELSQTELDDVLSKAGDDLAGPDVIGATEALVEAAVPTPRAWGWAAGIALVVLVAVGVGGRLIEQRASGRRRRQALTERWNELRDRADELAGPMIDLSTKVELADTDLSKHTYAQASELFTIVRRRVEQPPTTVEVDRAGEELDRLEALIGRLRRILEAENKKPGR